MTGPTPGVLARAIQASRSAMGARDVMPHWPGSTMRSRSDAAARMSVPADVSLPAQIGDRARDPHHPMHAPRGELESARHIEQDLPGLVVHGTGGEELATTQPTVGATSVPVVATEPGLHDPRRHRVVALRILRSDQLVSFHAGHDDTQVDAVEQRPADAAHVALRLPDRAAARARRISVPAAAAGVHGGDELEPRRIGHRAVGAHDLDGAVFERLTEGIEDVAVELGELIEEKHAVVRLGDKARSQVRPATDHGRIRRRVVRRHGTADASRSVSGTSCPATLRMTATSRASVGVSGGNSPGVARASRVLPGAR